jgi:hypothetical protein
VSSNKTPLPLSALILQISFGQTLYTIIQKKLQLITFVSAGLTGYDIVKEDGEDVPES